MDRLPPIHLPRQDTIELGVRTATPPIPNSEDRTAAGTGITRPNHPVSLSIRPNNNNNTLGSNNGSTHTMIATGGKLDTPVSPLSPASAISDEQSPVPHSASLVSHSHFDSAAVATPGGTRLAPSASRQRRSSLPMQLSPSQAAGTPSGAWSSAAQIPKGPPTREELMELLEEEFLFPGYLIVRMKESFDLVDKDKSGTIETKELFTLLEDIGLSPTMEQVTSLIEAVDINKNGLIDFVEFLYLCAIKMLEDTEKHDDMWEVFDIFDATVDDQIDVEELQENVAELLGEDLSREEASSMIRFAQLSHHKQGQLGVNWTQFTHAVEGKHPEKKRESRRKSVVRGGGGAKSPTPKR